MVLRRGIGKHSRHSIPSSGQQFRLDASRRPRPRRICGFTGPRAGTGQASAGVEYVLPAVYCVADLPRNLVSGRTQYSFCRFRSGPARRLLTSPRLQDGSSNLPTASIPRLHRSPTFEVPLTLGPGMHQIDVPPELATIDELIVPTSYKAMSNDDPAFALFVLYPQAGLVEVLPQKWFTARAVSGGQQWISRAARDQESHRIFGECFGVGHFSAGRRWLPAGGVDAETVLRP